MVSSDGGRRLTADGVRALRSERHQDDDAPLLLQVVYMHRYLADPALKQLLSGDDASEELDRDVFDVVLSDGRLKTKCILSPALNHVVWRGQVARFDILQITDFGVLQVKNANASSDEGADAVTRPVCFIKGCEIIARKSDRFLVYASSSPTQEAGSLVEKDTGDDLAFASSVNERETELIPVAGERMYYLPLNSDHYTLEATAAAQVQATREYCSNLTAPDMFDLHSLADITEMISSSSSHFDTSGISREQFPPMIGVVRVKSRVTHVGEPEITNPFPFVFHIVIVDRTFAVEIAFFGSMCAKFFPTIEEGDLIQVRGYSVSVSKPEETDAGAAEHLFFFEHESEGQVLHLPATYWKMLGATQILWNFSALKRGSDYRRTIRMQPPSPSPIWLECNFVTTRMTHAWAVESISMHNKFDFVGVLSFVGKICRQRKRKRASGDEDDDNVVDTGEESGPVAEYRWVKAVDERSSTELIILLHDCSQPQQFRSLKAGDTVMLTKLQWVSEDDETHANLKTVVDDHVFGAHYAVSGSFTVLRMNSAVSAFDTQEKCIANLKFAKKLMANAKVREQSSTGESWLEGDMIKQYHTPQLTGVQPTDSGNVPTTLGRQVNRFSEFSSICEKLETLEHRRVAVVGRLLSIPVLHAEDEETVPSQATSAFEIEFGDSLDTTHSQKATLRVNPVLRNLNQQALPAEAAAQSISSLNGTISKAMKCLLEMLSPSILDELIADASKASGSGGKRKRKKHKKNKKQPITADPTGDENDSVHNGAAIATVSPAVAPAVVEPPIASTLSPPTPAFLEQWLTKGNRVFLFSTHLYRTQTGPIDVEVDAILPYALEV